MFWNKREHNLTVMIGKLLSNVFENYGTTADDWIASYKPGFSLENGFYLVQRQKKKKNIALNEMIFGE